MAPTSVFVGGLNSDIGKEDLEREFSKFGTLSNVWVARNPPGFAFIEFEEADDAQEAIKEMNGTTINGSEIRVDISRNSGRGRRGGRGGGGSGGGFRGSRGGGFRGRRDGGGYSGGGGYDGGYRNFSGRGRGGGDRYGGDRSDGYNRYGGSGGGGYRSRSPVGNREESW